MRQDVRDFCRKNYGEPTTTFEQRNERIRPMTTQAQPTPTPWHRNVSPAWRYPIYADRNGDPNGRDWIHIAFISSSNPNGEADLNFIVKAVNNHQKLVDALNMIAAMTVCSDSEVHKLAVESLGDMYRLAN